MKQKFTRLFSLACACMLLLGALTGCSLTKTTVSSDIQTDISYIDVSTPENSSGNAGESSAASDPSSGSKTPSSSGNVVSGSGDNSAHNAGTVDNSAEEKLTGTLELQIFVGGYGEKCWEYAIEEFQKLQPNLEINAHMDANVNAQMKTRWAKDNPPDFVFLDGTNMPKSTWMEENKLRDLSSLYKNGKVYGTSTPIR